MELNKLNIILIIILIFSYISCNDDDKNSKATSEKNKDPIVKEFLIEIDIKDTLVFDKRNFGNIHITNILQDSIKKHSEDGRLVTSCLNIYNLKMNILKINESVCDTFYQANDDFFKVRIPFYVTPKKSGEQFIGGIIDEIFVLPGYSYEDSTKIRRLEFTHHFKKEVYVK